MVVLNPFLHWVLVCPVFNSIRINRLGNTVKILKFFVKFHNTSSPNFNRQDNFRHIGAVRSSPIAIENRYIHNLDNHPLSLFTVFEIRTVFYFLLGGRLTSNREIFANRAWAKLFKCQFRLWRIFSLPLYDQISLLPQYDNAYRCRAETFALR